METENNNQLALRTSAQEVLVVKILQSKKILDKEYQQLRSIWEHQILTSKDASVFIEYVLSSLRFRRYFLNGNRKSFKICQACKIRDNVKRYDDLSKKNLKYWLCDNCALNLSTSVVPTKEII